VAFSFSELASEIINLKSRDSSVGIATGYGMDDQGSIPGKGKRFFSSPQCPHRLRPGRETDHSPPISAEVENSGPIPPLPHASSWHGALSVKHRDNFTLYVFNYESLRQFMGLLEWVIGPLQAICRHKINSHIHVCLG
jgi:hypothetical protein